VLKYYNEIVELFLENKLNTTNSFNFFLLLILIFLTKNLVEEEKFLKSE